MRKPLFITRHSASPDLNSPTCDAFKERGLAEFHRSLPSYAPTPLLRSVELAAELGLGEVYVKDESRRLDVKAFKVLGASWAVHRLLREEPGIEVFATATDGNHGMAVAWSARHFGRRAVVLMPRGTAPARSERIAALGATVEVLNADYDDVVAEAASRSERSGWTLVQDTAWPGYEKIPALIQAGYLTLFEEIAAQLGATSSEPGLDLVLLPVGVGSLAATAVWFYHHHYREKRPRLLALEPLDADCLRASLDAGRSRRVPTPGTLMAGLNCGTVSSIAWPLLRDGLDGALALSDEGIPRAMRRYSALQPPIVSGETGAATLAALTQLVEEPELEPLRGHLGLSPLSRVLLLNTEGDTDPSAYARIVHPRSE